MFCLKTVEDQYKKTPGWRWRVKGWLSEFVTSSYRLDLVKHMENYGEKSQWNDYQHYQTEQGKQGPVPGEYFFSFSLIHDCVLFVSIRAKCQMLEWHFPFVSRKLLAITCCIYLSISVLSRGQLSSTCMNWYLQFKLCRHQIDWDLKCCHLSQLERSVLYAWENDQLHNTMRQLKCRSIFLNKDK